MHVEQCLNYEYMSCIDEGDAFVDARRGAAACVGSDGGDAGGMDAYGGYASCRSVSEFEEVGGVSSGLKVITDERAEGEGGKKQPFELRNWPFLSWYHHSSAAGTGVASPCGGEASCGGGTSRGDEDVHDD